MPNHPKLTDRKSPIAVHRAAIVCTFARFLSNAGVPVEPRLRQAGIPAAALERLNNCIPSSRFYSFVVNTAHDSGIQDLGFQVGRVFGASSVDPQLTHRLNQSPTLYAGLLVASELMNKSVTNCRIGVTRSGDGKHALFFHRPSCGQQHPAVEQIGSFGLMTLLAIVRIFAGPEWLPNEIGLMTRKAPDNNICEAFPNTRIRTSPTCSYVMVDNALLSQPPFHHENVGRTPLSLDCEAFAYDVARSLKQVVRAYLTETDLSLSLLAELFNVTPRTLQRKLAEAGTSYSKILEQTRFEAARSMLEKPHFTVTDVSCSFGYSDPTNFARAFRRVAGVSPSEFHQQHASGN